MFEGPIPASLGNASACSLLPYTRTESQSHSVFRKKKKNILTNTVSVAALLENTSHAEVYAQSVMTIHIWIELII
jgi:hypothetical protein